MRVKSKIASKRSILKRRQSQLGRRGVKGREMKAEHVQFIVKMQREGGQSANAYLSRAPIFKKRSIKHSSQKYWAIQDHTALNLIIMASVLKAQKKNQSVKDSKGKRKADAMDIDDEVPSPKRLKNKQRVLMLSSRGVTHRMRHLMNDLEVLLPHIKKGKTTLLQAHL